MVKIGELAKRFRLSRSTLLYYDSIGLLKPSRRTDGAYRLYGEADVKRLERICVYRDMGIPLSTIAELLRGKSEEAAILEFALLGMEKQVEDIRRKQQKIMQAIQAGGAGESNVDIFTDVLKSLGFGSGDMRKFHAAYETSSRDGHIAFLRFLGLSDPEIEAIRSNTP